MSIISSISFLVLSCRQPSDSTQVVVTAEKAEQKKTEKLKKRNKKRKREEKNGNCRHSHGCSLGNVLLDDDDRFNAVLTN